MGKQSYQKGVEQADGQENDLIKLWQRQTENEDKERFLAQEIKLKKQQTKQLRKSLRQHRRDYFDSSLESENLLETIKEAVVSGFKSIPSQVVEAIQFLRLKLRRIPKKALGLILILAGSGILIMFFSWLYQKMPADQPGRPVITANKLDQDAALPRELPQDFDLLLPSGSSASDFDVVRISPEGVQASYAYLDRLDQSEPIFRVTQQKAPDNFDLQQAADSIQANSVIETEDNIIYYSYSEADKTQSLISLKAGNLIIIRSPKLLDDQSWLNYINSLE